MAVVLVVLVAIVDIVRVTAGLRGLVAARAVVPVFAVSGVFLMLVHATECPTGRVSG